VCNNRPIRQDYLDGLVWDQVVKLLENPDLVRIEIQRRIEEIQSSNPTRKRKEVLIKQTSRIRNSIEKLLDAYQEGLLRLDELRNRLPQLRKKQEAAKSELLSLEAAAVDQETFLRLADNMEEFLDRLRTAADILQITERQKVLRLVVKEILVYQDTVKIKHSIPVTGKRPSGTSDRAIESPFGTLKTPSYLLRSGSHQSSSGESVHEPVFEILADQRV
jgi:site-specific DNA recombinase